MTRSLVVQTGFLGDTVLTTALLSTLHQRGETVDVVCRPGSYDLLETHTAVNALHPFDKRRAGLLRLMKFARGLRPHGYARAYLPHQSLRSAIIAILAGAKARIGFADSAAAFLYTERVATAGIHEAERIASLAGPHEPTQTSLHIPSADRATAARLLGDVATKDEIVVVAPGSVWPTKRWPRFGALARVLAESASVVAVGSETDRGIIESHGLDLCGRTTIREAAAVIQIARLAITNDSAPLHIADALGTPALAIFGPTTTDLGFGPRAPSDRVAEVDGLSCRPCGRHGHKRCPLGHHRCMLDLEVESVAEIALEMLNRENEASLAT